MNSSDKSTNPGGQYYWKIGQAFITFNFVISLWAAVSIFKHKNRKKQVVLMNLAKCSSVLVMLKITVTQVVTVMGRVARYDVIKGDVMCEIVVDVSSCTYYLCNLSVYLFLWRRQHTLHFQQMQQTSHSKLFTLLSWFVLVLLLVGGITATVTIVAPSSYEASEIGCVRKHSPGQKQVLFAAILSQIATQIFLFALFVRPFLLIRRHYVTPETSEVAKVTNARLRRAIKSSMVSTGVIVTSDLVSVVMAGHVFPHSTPRSFVGLFYDLSLVLNVVFVFLTFENSRLRFNPFSKPKLGRQQTITFIRA